MDSSHDDSFFNLAQALRAFVELSVDQGASLEGDSGKLGWGMVLEADRALEIALELQMKELQKTLEMQRKDKDGGIHEGSGDGDVDMNEDESSTGTCCDKVDAEGNCTDTGCSGGHDHGDDHAHEDEMADADDSTKEGDEGYELVREQELVTVETVVETLTTHVSLLTFAGSLLNTVGKQQESDQSFNKAMEKLQVATTLLQDAAKQSQGSPDTPSNSKAPATSMDATTFQTDFKEPKDVGLTRASLYSAKAEATVSAAAGTKSTEWIPLYESALQQLDKVLEAYPNCAEAAADKGDLLCAWGDGYLTSLIGIAGLPGFDALLSAYGTELVNQIMNAASSSAAASASSSSSAATTSNPSQPDSATSLITTLKSMYAQANKAYTLAQTHDPQNAIIATRLGDLESTRILLYTPPPKLSNTHSLDSSNPVWEQNSKTVQVLLTNARTYYRRALDILGINYNRPTPKPQMCADDSTALSALLGYAKVLSRMTGGAKDKLEEVKIALFNWRKRGGSLEDSESPLEFGMEVLQQDWFSKMVM
jgi:tetratricopeptide (TPR) repeat protein